MHLGLSLSLGSAALNGGGGVDPRAAEIIAAAANAEPSEVMAIPPAFVGPCLGVGSSAVVSGGSGYAVNDTFQIDGGTLAAGGSPAVGRVLTVSSGAVTSFAMVFGGQYGVGTGERPTLSGVTTTALTGAGTGLTANIADSRSPINPTKTVFSGGSAIQPASLTDISGVFAGNPALASSGQAAAYISRTKDSGDFFGSTWSGTYGAGKAIRTDSATIDIVMTGSSKFMVYVTDVATGLRSRCDTDDYISSAAGFYFYTLDFGTSADRIIEFSMGINEYIRGVNVESTATVSAIDLGSTIKMAAVLDSWGEGVYSPASTTDRVTASYAYRLGERLGAPYPILNAIAGTGVINQATSFNNYAQRVEYGNLDVSLIGAMDLVWVPASQNDAGSSDGDVQTAWQSLITGIMTAQPDAIIVVSGPQQVASTTDSRHAAIKAATIAAAGGDKRVRYIDASPVTGAAITPTLGVDNAHLADRSARDAYGDAVATRILANLATMR